jgi:hypothetical protein
VPVGDARDGKHARHLRQAGLDTAAGHRACAGRSREPFAVLRRLMARGDASMVKNRRVQQGFTMLILGVSVLAFCSCSSDRSGSPVPSTSARAICTAVGRQLGAPPGVRATFFITAPVVAAGEHSNDTGLDAAVSQLSQALAHQSTTASLGGELATQTACARLGMWQVYH